MRTYTVRPNHNPLRDGLAKVTCAENAWSWTYYAATQEDAEHLGRRFQEGATILCAQFPDDRVLVHYHLTDRAEYEALVAAFDRLPWELSTHSCLGADDAPGLVRVDDWPYSDRQLAVLTERLGRPIAQEIDL